MVLKADSREVRRAVARVVAAYFLLHLREEQEKPGAILFEEDRDLSARQITQALAEQVRQEFDLREADLPSENLFRRWCELNGRFSYDDLAVPGYDRTFYLRLLDLRNGTPESREHYHERMRCAFDRFKYETQGFNVSFFLSSESVMRELMRERVRLALPAMAEQADLLLLSQSGGFQTAMYEYFESVLKKALAENLRLLHGILPQQVASELRLKGSVEPVFFQDAAVLFTDFEGFSQSTENLPPAEVIRRLDAYFTEFDRIAARHGLEKIKTIGDSYMAVAGVPDSHEDPVKAACDAAIEIRDASIRISEKIGPDGWRIRVGIHAGPLVAGVIGQHKFSYDVWGATVNLARRMESSGAPGMINVSSEVHGRMAEQYRWTARGAQPVKSLGSAEMYYLLGTMD